jgi:hypothetical protein
MKIRTIITGVLLTSGVVAAAYLFGIAIIMFAVAVYNVLVATLILKNKDAHDRFSRLMNPYRYEVYKEKSEEFKASIKQDPIGNFIMAALFAFIAYKAMLNPIVMEARQYVAIVLFVALSYFAETIMLRKSSTWQEYRKLTIYLAVAAMAAVFLLV